MFSAGSSVQQQLQELETALGFFGWADQDWGIVNSDSSRVREFVVFFEQNHNDHWSPWTVAEFLDLVMESASDAISDDPHFHVGSIDGFVTLAAPLAADRLEYWTSHDWPITPHLHELGY